MHNEYKVQYEQQCIVVCCIIGIDFISTDIIKSNTKAIFVLYM